MKVVQALLCDGLTNPDRKDSYGDTLLSWAVRHGHTEVVRTLVSHGRTLLFYAAEWLDGGC
jgi:FOG: Ankyrin repeat